MEPITNDVFTIVNALIIEKLEKGIVPWKKPWNNAGPPRNLVTGRPYRGVNLLLLANLDYGCSEFLTFKQVKSLGGKVKKGEKAHLVIAWLWTEEQKDKQEEVNPLNRPLLRYYYVFNVMQCTGILPKVSPIPLGRNNPIELCEAVVANMPNRPKILYNESEAYYDAYNDYINMPKLQFFASSGSFYSVLFHELIHSTGHEDRLNRKELMERAKFGSEPYSIEELTAEIGACYLASYTGITLDELDNSISYIDGWLKRLKSEKKFIVYASARAQHAVDYILNIECEDSRIANNIEGDKPWSKLQSD